MLTGSMDKTARVWDLMSGACLHTYFTPNPVSDVTVRGGGAVNILSSLQGESDVIGTYKMDKFMHKHLHKFKANKVLNINANYKIPTAKDVSAIKISKCGNFAAIAYYDKNVMV